MITASDGRVWSLVTDLRGLAEFCNDPECVDQERVTTIAHVIGHLMERSVSAWRLVLLADWEDPRARLGRVARIDKLTALSEALAKLGLWSISLCVNVRAWGAAVPAEREWDAILRGRYPHAGVGRERTRRIVAVDDLRREQPWLPEAWRQFLSVVGLRLPGHTVAVPRSGLVFDRVVDAYCQTIRLAIELLESEALQAVGRRRAAHWEFLLADSDKPRTDSAMRARTERYGGWVQPTQFGSELGETFDTGIAVGVLGKDARDYLMTWVATDPRIYVVKLGETPRAPLGDSVESSRKARDYTSAHTLGEVKLAYDAFAFANRTGRILNGRATVSWFLIRNESLDVQWACAKRFLRNLKQHYRDLSGVDVPDKADREPWIVHVHENPGGNCFNTHLAMFVPVGFLAGFCDAVRGIAERAVDGYRVDFSEGTLVKPEVRQADANACFGQWRWFHYMLKGTRRDKVLVADGPDGTRWLDDVLQRRYEEPGPRQPRRPRLGLTTNLQPPAQRAFADASGCKFVSLWDEQVQSGRIDVRELYSDRYLRQWQGHDAAMVTAASPSDLELDHGDHPLARLIIWPGGF